LDAEGQLPTSVKCHVALSTQRLRDARYAARGREETLLAVMVIIALAGVSLYLAGHVLQTATLPWLNGLLHALTPHIRAVHPVTSRHG